jgi:hypothetical protein
MEFLYRSRFVRKLRGSQRPEAAGIILTAAGEEAQVGSKSVRLLAWRSSARICAELHEKAFRRLGGCPKVVVLDNLKEGVLVPDLYDPTVNPLFRDVLAHYGVIPPLSPPCSTAFSTTAISSNADRGAGGPKQTCPIRRNRDKKRITSRAISYGRFSSDHRGS